MAKTRLLKNFRVSRRVFSYPYILFMTVFVVLPLAFLFINAFLADGSSDGGLSLKNFADFATGEAGFKTLGDSALVGLVTTAVCLLIGYPVALFIHRYHKGSALALFFIVPMWVNFLMRTLATRQIFLALNVEMGWVTAVVGMIYNFLPFMILPLYTVISNIDESYIEAARDLGADNFTVLVKTILPLSLPGILSGITMVFVPAISTFAISEFLAGNKILLFGDSIHASFTGNQHGVGSVMSIIMLVFVLISNSVMNRYDKRETKNVW